MAFFDNPYDEDVSGLTDGWDSPVLFVRAIAESAPTFVNFHDASGFSFSFRTFEVDLSAQSDAISRALTMARGLPESAPATPTVSEARTFGRSIAESAGSPASSWSEVVRFVRALAQSAPASDALVSHQVFVRPLAQSAPASAQMVRQMMFGRNLAQTASASESIAEARVFLRPIGESAPAVATVARQMVMARLSAESMSSSDALAHNRVQGRTMSESAPVSSVDLETLHTHKRSISESVSGLSAAIARAVTSMRHFTVIVPVATNTLARKYIFVDDLDEDVSLDVDLEGLLLTLPDPPVVTINAVSEITQQDGTDVAVIDFAFDVPVVRWVARFNSTGPTFGHLVDNYEGPVTLSGSAVVPVRSEIEEDGVTAWSHALHVYGQTVDDVWSEVQLVDIGSEE